MLNIQDMKFSLLAANQTYCKCFQHWKIGKGGNVFVMEHAYAKAEKGHDGVNTNP